MLPLGTLALSCLLVMGKLVVRAWKPLLSARQGGEAPHVGHTERVCALVSGMLAALLLHQGNIPRLFQKNLLYGQKSKYKIPKARLAHAEGGDERRKGKGEKSDPAPRA